jgi:hypothetical protein
MIVIGLDPGAHSPAHVALVDGAVSWCSNMPLPPADVVFIEGQHERPRTSKHALMVLSKYAGLHAGAYMAHGARVYELPVDEWREAVLARSRMLPKDVFHGRLAKLTPSPIRRAGPDYVDAYWIAKAGLVLQAKGAILLELKWLKTGSPKTPRTKRKSPL